MSFIQATHYINAFLLAFTRTRSFVVYDASCEVLGEGPPAPVAACGLMRLAFTFVASLS